MKSVFDSLQTLSEFVLLGGMITVTMAYAFIWIHPVRDSLIGYYRESRDFLFGHESSSTSWSLPGGAINRWSSQGESESSKLRMAAITVISVGYLYVAGSVGNAVGYWLMEPSHNAYLVRTYWFAHDNPDEPKECDQVANLSEIPLLDWLSLKRVIWGRGLLDCERAAYVITLKDEAEWRTYDRQSADDELDDILKHIRLERGAAVCALVIAILAVAKLFSSLLVISLSGAPKRWLFGILIDAKPPQVDEGVDKKHPPEQSGLSHSALLQKKLTSVAARAAWVYLVTILISILFYGASLSAYLNTEREYHGFAHYGAASSKEKFEKEISKGINPSTQAR